MMKTITKQPILFTDVPVADLRNSMKHDLKQNLIKGYGTKFVIFFWTVINKRHLNRFINTSIHCQF